MKTALTVKNGSTAGTALHLLLWLIPHWPIRFQEGPEFWYSVLWHFHFMVSAQLSFTHSFVCFLTYTLEIITRTWHILESPPVELQAGTTKARLQLKGVDLSWAYTPNSSCWEEWQRRKWSDWSDWRMMSWCCFVGFLLKSLGKLWGFY